MALDDGPKEAGAAPDSARRLWSAIKLSPAARIALLGPTALAAIANIQDVGRIALFITDSWRPVMRFMQELIAGFLPVDFPYPPETVTMFAFFLPFIAFGIPQVVTGKSFSIRFGVLALGAMVTLIVLQMEGTRSDGGNTLLGSAVTVIIAWAFCAAAYIAAAVMLRPPIDDDPSASGRFQRGLLPITFFALLMLSAASQREAPDWSDWRLFVGAALVSLPLLAPRRLVEVSVIALSIISISLLHSGVSEFLSNSALP